MSAVLSRSIGSKTAPMVKLCLTSKRAWCIVARATLSGPAANIIIFRLLQSVASSSVWPGHLAPASFHEILLMGAVTTASTSPSIAA